MAEILIYMVEDDVPILVDWLNGEENVAWVLKVAQVGCLYRWQAFHTIASVAPGEYCLWHTQFQRLTIPSGSPRVMDTAILDPFLGWNQWLDHDRAQTPWFGALHPGPFHFCYNPKGHEAPNSIGRSGFSWLADYFRPIGHGADLDSKKWWQRLRRFVKKETVRVSWPPDIDSRLRAYVFPRANEMHMLGTPLDVNP